MGIRPEMCFSMENSLKPEFFTKYSEKNHRQIELRQSTQTTVT